MENTPDNRKKLAEELIEHWLDDELKEYARLQLIKEYKKDPSVFKQDWEAMFEDK